MHALFWFFVCVWLLWIPVRDGFTATLISSRRSVSTSINLLSPVFAGGHVRKGAGWACANVRSDLSAPPRMAQPGLTHTQNPPPQTHTHIWHSIISVMPQLSRKNQHVWCWGIGSSGTRWNDWFIFLSNKKRGKKRNGGYNWAELHATLNNI